jgi:glycine cleavage system H lipoate-binding protein
MTGFRYEDIFATKHLEYLVVIVFLILLILFWRLLQKPTGKILETAGASTPSSAQWFYFPEGFYYHQGHSWAIPQGSLIKVGIDDFAQKMIGRIDTVDITPVGSSIEQGGIGWRLTVDSKNIDMLSPIMGEVVEINKKVLENSEIINQDPYGEGWLMIVRPHNRDVNFKNLLTGKSAKACVEVSIDILIEGKGSNFGLMYQDGAAPVSGIARTLSPENWDSLVKNFFLTEEEQEML